MVELIITEKPNAAQKIAEALADGKAIKESINKVPYYSITHGNQDIIVGCAVGHLFGLAEKKKAGMNYPVFEMSFADIQERKQIHSLSHVILMLKGKSSA